MELIKEMKKTLVFINVTTAIIIMCLTALPWMILPSDDRIIGGADGPTVIWLSAGTMDALTHPLPWFLCALLLANAYALCKSTKKASTEA